MNGNHFINRIILGLCLISCFLDTGDSIKCWDCNSINDPFCADPFDNQTVFMKNCEYEPALPHFPGTRATMCRKIRQKINGKWRYWRGCAYLGNPGIGGDERYCLMRTGSYNVFSEICTCVTRDGCNSASSFELPKLILLFSTFGGLLYQFH